MLVNMLVEGTMDEAAARRIIEYLDLRPLTCYGKQGSGYIKTRIRGFNRAARFTPVLALVDFMDTNLACPPQVVSEWLPNRNSRMLFRVVVRELESWLLADREGIADFLSVDEVSIPANPESINDPKRFVVNLAKKSERRSVREALVPDSGSTSSVGRLYTWEMRRFISKHWNIEAAMTRSKSLDRCLQRLMEIKNAPTQAN